MTVEPTRMQRKALQIKNRQYGKTLAIIPQEKWPVSVALSMNNPPVEAWRSQDFLVQVFVECDGIERLSVCRTSHNGQRWEDEITWDELQRLKAECGRGNRYAVEVYPADSDVVNVANMRHLWVLLSAPPFAWKKD